MRSSLKSKQRDRPFLESELKDLRWEGGLEFTVFRREDADQSSVMEFDVEAVTRKFVGARYVVFVVLTFAFANAEPVWSFENITSSLYCVLLFAFVTVKVPFWNVTTSPDAKRTFPEPFSIVNVS